MSFEPIAVIGQSCILPGALDPAQLWDLVLAGQDMVSSVPPGYWRLDPATILAPPGDKAKDRTWSDRGGYVSGFSERFDAGGFLLPPEEIGRLDVGMQWVLHGVREALASAGLPAPLPLESPKTGLVLGNLSYPTPGLVEFAETTWFGAQSPDIPRPPRDPSAPPEAVNRFSSGMPAHLAAEALNLHGGAFALDAACASSLYAIKLACDRLQDGRCDVMVAGAVNRTDDLFIHIGFCALQALSRRGESRPFAADADGLVPAEGAAFVVLKRLADAVAAGDTILGVIRGIGLSNDGNAGGFLSPSAEGQVRAMRAAYAAAGINPTAVSLLECHATGTPVGDATELQSAAQLFGGCQDLPIGSLKSNLGHLITAAGAAGLIKLLAALRTGIRPPSRRVDTPLAALADSPLRLLQAPEAWPAEPGVPRRAALSAFGFGGNNAHLIVEEWLGQASTPASTQGSALPLGAGHRNARQDEANATADVAIVDVEVTAGPFEDARSFLQALVSGAHGSRAETIDLVVAGLRFPPKDLQQTLPQQLLVLEVARRLAARHPELSPGATSVLVGMGCDPEIARYSLRWRLGEWVQRWPDTGKSVTAEWVAAAREALIPGLEAAGVVGTMPNIPANRINAQLDYRGPSYTVAGEELSGLRALEIAVDALRRGEIDAALVGAVDLSDEPVHGAASKLLDAARRKAGDAAVVLLLKRAADVGSDEIVALVAPGQNSGAADRPQLALGLAPGHTALTQQFGHAHAASGLLHVAAAALCVKHGLYLSSTPPAPWLAAEPRTAEVRIDALGGQTAAVTLSGAGPAAPVGLDPEDIAQIHVFSGADAAGVAAALARGEESNEGPARLAIVATPTTFARQVQAAGDSLARKDLPLAGVQALAKGIYWSPAPMAGELAFVFTPAAAAYGGMGRDLFLALPSLAGALVKKFPCLAKTQAWLDAAGAPSDPFSVLQGCAMLTQAHAILTQDLLGLRPAAMLGVSSGETNSLFASGAWHDMDAMFEEIDRSGMYTREIAGEYQAAARAWHDRAGGPGEWAGWRVLAPAAEVQAALQGETYAYLTMINAPADCIVAGEANACRRVVEKIGRSRCVQNEGEIIAHHPVMGSWESEWHAIHSRTTQPVPGVRFYSNARGGAYTLDRESAAAALTDQATAGVDFRRVVEAAYADGVRIFVEHGPRNVCSGWIRSILGDRNHLVVALDRPQNGVEQLLEAVAQLLAAGVPLNYGALNGALAAGQVDTATTAGAAGRTLPFPAHYPPVILPPLPAAAGKPTIAAPQLQHMAPAPSLPPVLRFVSQAAAAVSVVIGGNGAGAATVRRAAEEISVEAIEYTNEIVEEYSMENVIEDAVEYSPSEETIIEAPVAQEYADAPRPAGAAHPLGEQLLAFYGTVSAAHQKFLAQQARAMNRLVELRSLVGEYTLSETTQPVPPAAALPPASIVPPAPAVPPVIPATAAMVPAVPASAPKPASMPQPEPAVMKTPPAPKPGAPTPAPRVRRLPSDYPGPKLDRRQLEQVASGKISEVLGPIFARQDHFVRQVRMPMPPLLLADRVLGIDAEAGAVGQKGVIWTETDILADAWYLHAGHMPAGVLIEAGQADLLLVSYLGADFVNQGERVYRLLGCEATFHAPLPVVGDTLHYEIHLDGYAQQGPVRLFFFHYDCYRGDERIFSVRQGQAGFFSDEELAHSNGVIWDPHTAEHVQDARVDPPAVACERSSFSAAEVAAFAEGRVVECFGEGFAAAQVHVRTPSIARGRMLLFDDIVEFSPHGGPWGRGYLRAEDHIHPDEWFFAGHFKNDPCMPGTMMLEGCLQTMAFYMAGLGYTLKRDGWRFEPAQEEMYKLVCRGQVTPTAKTVVYEVFVEEVIDGPIPTLYADLLCTVDGLAAFHCRRMGLRLVPAFPLESRPALLAGHELADPEPRRAAQTLGHTYDARSIAACAWGAPSAAFGPRFARFDGPQRCPRLPGPPYLFMTRVTEIDAPPAAPDGSPVAGGSIVAEYQVPPDAWYFGENGCRTMPYAVLLEAALQPCGWFASYKGSVLAAAEELYFRNLDGTATQYGEVLPDAGLLRTHVTNTSLARLGAMTIVGFDVTCFVGDVRVFGMATTFGFFPKAALAAQAGLPADDERRRRLSEPSDFRRELGPRPPRYFAGNMALPGPMLLLLDRISGFWPQGGAAGLGRVRAEIDVDARDWFFQSHFMGDSVQPGSLGLEAMLQTLQFYMMETEMGAGIEQARFEPIRLDTAMTWKYRGQVMPTARRVTVELEITAKSNDGLRAAAVGAASLWVDGLRIYEATNVGMRIVPGDVTDSVAGSAAGLEPVAGDERLDPAVDTWLNDHCPTWTLPALAMMSMADRLAAGAAVRAPGRKVIGFRNLRVLRWLPFAVGKQAGGSARTLRLLGTPYGSDAVTMQLLAWDASRTAWQAVAAGDVVVGEHWQLPPGAWSPIAGENQEPDPYAGGVLFHGPAYQLLTDLRMDSAGSSYWLDLDAGGVPIGLLNQGLLDAATHGIPHDALWRWSGEIPRDVAAYPVAITTAVFYGPAPVSGRVRCEARFGGFRGGDRQFPIIRVQIVRDEVVWAELELVEMLLPKGPLGQAEPQDRRSFLAERLYVPGLALSESDGTTTSVSDTQVKASDWLPGTVAAVYGLDGEGLEQMAMNVAIRDHAARQFAVHPGTLVVQCTPEAGSSLSVAGEGAQLVRVAAPSHPLNSRLLQVARSGTSWQAADAPEPAQVSLDTTRVQAFWRERASAQDTLVEDLTLALMRRFVRTIEIDDPAGFGELQGRGVLYLANHQLDLESALFVSAAASLQGTVTTAIARQELGESWIGPFFDICFEHPLLRNPHMLLLIDRGSPEAVLQALAAAVKEAAVQNRSLLVHVEGKHALAARQEVEVVSTSLIDLAVANSMPIVPVRFLGGVPLEPVAEPLAFPPEYGQQDFLIGAPLLPETLAGLPSAARRAAVLGALNGFGGRWRSEVPSADAAFGAAVAAWRQAQGVSEVQAVLWRTLAEASDPSTETKVLLALAAGDTASAEAYARELDPLRSRWLAGASRALFGPVFEGLLNIF